MPYTISMNMHYPRSVEVDGKTLALVSLDVVSRFNGSREIMVTPDNREIVAQIYHNFLEGKTDVKSMNVQHWIGIESRVFVIAFEDICFLY